MSVNSKGEVKESAALQRDYDSLKPLAERFLEALIEQINFIISKNSLALAVPIQGRIKDWSSIAEKCNRKELNLESLTTLSDLIGLRLIFLFSRDSKTAIEHISKAFLVIEQEDAFARLSESQFGYQSHHLVVSIPDDWTTVPTFFDCEKFKVEIQIRTIAQHAWAAASHQLQYKREKSVPPEVKRSINRVSALLETVDLEFERVLNEREQYVAEVDTSAPHGERLNVDILATILKEKLPMENYREGEEYRYDALVKELEDAEITDSVALVQLIDEKLDETIKQDQEIVNGKHDRNYRIIPERQEQGVFFTHMGMVRQMLEKVGEL